MRSARVVFGFLVLCCAGAAQQYVISTVAGGAPPAMPVRGVDLPINTRGVATDAAGNVYFTSTLDCVFKLDPNGIVTLAAGNSRPGYSGDGGPAASAQLNSPPTMVVDRAGNLFIADTGNHRVRKVSPSGIIVTVAGNGSVGFSGDAGPAASAQLNSPRGLAVDSGGNLFIADIHNHRVRKVSTDGIIATVAGNGSVGLSGDGGPATSSPLFPTGVAVDSAGNLFIVDSNSRVRKVSRDGIITTVAGNGTNGFSGDGGPATAAAFTYPAGVAVDSAGNVYVADLASNVIRILRPMDKSVFIGAVVDAAKQTCVICRVNKRGTWPAIGLG
jgi:NHL repeat-containing protein